MKKTPIKVNASAGFTLIELIVVIVILGILAGVAVPRFMSQTSSARKAAINGFAGNLSGAVALVQQEYIAEGNTSTSTATVATMNGTSVAVSAGTGAPMAASLSSSTAGPLSSFSGFTIGTASAGVVTINLSPSTVASCYAVYNDGQSTAQPTVTTTTSGC